MPKPQKAVGVAAVFFSRLAHGMDSLAIHNTAFAVAKEHNALPAKLFEECYMTLLGKPRGPKLGKLVEAIGVEKVKKDVL